MSADAICAVQFVVGGIAMPKRWRSKDKKPRAASAVGVFVEALPFA